MKVTNPKGPDKGSIGVLRGSGWSDYSAFFVGVHARAYCNPGGGREEGDMGFRIVCNGRKG